jgi:hypothetical protein
MMSKSFAKRLATLVLGPWAALAGCAEDFHSLFIQNDTGQTWTALYVVSSGSTSWGSNELFGGEVVDTGREIRTGSWYTGSYDVRAEATSGNAWELLKVSVRQDTSVSLSSSHQVSVAPTKGTLRITNKIDYGDGGDYTIVEFYITPDDSNTWGSNLLSSSIAFNQSRSFEADPGTWDTRAVDASSNVYKKQNNLVISNGLTTDISITELDVGQP